MSDELKHWGVKGMKWKDHDYAEDDPQNPANKVKESMQQRLGNMLNKSAKVQAAFKKFQEAGRAARINNAKLKSAAAANIKKATAKAAPALAKAKAKAAPALKRLQEKAEKSVAKSKASKLIKKTANTKASYQNAKAAKNPSYQHAPASKKVSALGKVARNVNAKVTKAVAKATGNYTYKPHEQTLITRDPKATGTRDADGRKIVNLNSLGARTKSMGNKAPSKAERKQQLKLAAKDIKNNLLYRSSQKDTKAAVKAGLQVLKGNAAANKAEKQAAAKAAKAAKDAKKITVRSTTKGKDGQLKVKTKTVKPGTAVSRAKDAVNKAKKSIVSKATIAREGREQLKANGREKASVKSSIANLKGQLDSAKKSIKSKATIAREGRDQKKIDNASKAARRKELKAQIKAAEKRQRELDRMANMLRTEQSIMAKYSGNKVKHSDMELRNALWHQFDDKYDQYDILLHLYAGLLYELDALCCSEGLSHADSDFSIEVEEELATLNDAQYNQVIEAIAEYEAREFGL